MSCVNAICVICVTQLKEADQEAEMDSVALRCGHVFHKPCLDDWFQRKQICPTCQAIGRNEDMLKLFFTNETDNKRTDGVYESIDKRTENLETVIASFHELKNEFGLLETQMMSLQKEKFDLVDQLNSKEKELAQFLTECQVNLNKIEDLKQSLVLANRKLSNNKNTIEGLESEIEKLREENLLLSRERLTHMEDTVAFCEHRKAFEMEKKALLDQWDSYKQSSVQDEIAIIVGAGERLSDVVQRNSVMREKNDGNSTLEKNKLEIVQGNPKVRAVVHPDPTPSTSTSRGSKVSSVRGGHNGRPIAAEGNIPIKLTIKKKLIPNLADSMDQDSFEALISSDSSDTEEVYVPANKKAKKSARRSVEASGIRAGLRSVRGRPRKAKSNA